MSDDKLGQCAHGYYGLCPHCYDSLRAELAELRARHAFRSDDEAARRQESERWPL